VPEFQSPAIHDELRFDVRKALMQDNAREPLAFLSAAAMIFRESSRMTVRPEFHP
jgi:hypothetical protein